MCLNCIFSTHSDAVWLEWTHLSSQWTTRTFWRKIMTRITSLRRQVKPCSVSQQSLPWSLESQYNNAKFITPYFSLTQRCSSIAKCWSWTLSQRRTCCILPERVSKLHFPRTGNLCTSQLCEIGQLELIIKSFVNYSTLYVNSRHFVP